MKTYFVTVYRRGGRAGSPFACNQEVYAERIVRAANQGAAERQVRAEFRDRECDMFPGPGKGEYLTYSARLW